MKKLTAGKIVGLAAVSLVVLVIVAIHVFLMVNANVILQPL